MEKNKITVVGCGYVGMSLSVLLAQFNAVKILDISHERIDKVNNKKSTVADNEIEGFLANKNLNLSGTTDKNEAYKDANFIIIATPTNFDETANCFDTSAVDAVVKDALKCNKDALIIIKSTIPVGHTKKLQSNFSTNRIIFSPEFLREGKALKDNLSPSRIIVGSHSNDAKVFAKLLVEGSEKEVVETLFMSSSEAEAVKLFANTYLAMRVAFFNELDSYAFKKELDTKNIINGICLDDRIGDGYNNPSFGYGGYCLPKDTKQLLSNFGDVPQNLIEAIVLSNSTRKNMITDEILRLNPTSVGFYKLAMKEGSDNFRSSAIEGIIMRIKSKGIKVFIHEPSLIESNFHGLKVINSFAEFKKRSDIIVANRKTKDLEGVDTKIFSRDLFGNN